MNALKHIGRNLKKLFSRRGLTIGLAAVFVAGSLSLTGGPIGHSDTAEAFSFSGAWKSVKKAVSSVKKTVTKVIKKAVSSVKSVAKKVSSAFSSSGKKTSSSSSGGGSSGGGSSKSKGSNSSSNSGNSKNSSKSSGSGGSSGTTKSAAKQISQAELSTIIKNKLNTIKSKTVDSQGNTVVQVVGPDGAVRRFFIAKKPATPAERSAAQKVAQSASKVISSLFGGIYKPQTKSKSTLLSKLTDHIPFSSSIKQGIKNAKSLGSGLTHYIKTKNQERKTNVALNALGSGGAGGGGGRLGTSLLVMNTKAGSTTKDRNKVLYGKGQFAVKSTDSDAYKNGDKGYYRTADGEIRHLTGDKAKDFYEKLFGVNRKSDWEYLQGDKYKQQLAKDRAEARRIATYDKRHPNQKKLENIATFIGSLQAGGTATELGTAGSAAAKAGSKASKGIPGIIKSIRNKAGSAASIVSELASKFGNSTKNIGNKAGGAISGGATKLGNAAKNLGSKAVSGGKSGLSGARNTAGRVASSATSKVKNLTSRAKDLLNRNKDVYNVTSLKPKTLSQKLGSILSKGRDALRFGNLTGRATKIGGKVIYGTEKVTAYIKGSRTATIIDDVASSGSRNAVAIYNNGRRLGTNLPAKPGQELLEWSKARVYTVINQGKVIKTRFPKAGAAGIVTTFLAAGGTIAAGNDTKNKNVGILGANLDGPLEAVIKAQRMQQFKSDVQAAKEAGWVIDKNHSKIPPPLSKAECQTRGFKWVTGRTGSVKQCIDFGQDACKGKGQLVKDEHNYCSDQVSKYIAYQDCKNLGRVWVAKSGCSHQADSSVGSGQCANKGDVYVGGKNTAIDFCYNPNKTTYQKAHQKAQSTPTVKTYPELRPYGLALKPAKPGVAATPVIPTDNELLNLLLGNTSGTTTQTPFLFTNGIPSSGATDLLELLTGPLSSTVPGTTTSTVASKSATIANFLTNGSKNIPMVGFGACASTGSCGGKSGCVRYANYRIQKWGLPAISVGVVGGKDMVRSAINNFGWQKTTVPLAGSMFSDPSAGGGYGHVGLVRAVLDNGDIVVEDNYTGSETIHSYTKAELGDFQFAYPPAK